MLQMEARQALKQVTDTWWMFLLAGLGWIVVSLVVLRLNLASVATVGVLLGILFLVSAADELVVAAARPTWAWLRILLSVFFVVGAIWCFVHPYDAFWSLAAVLGFLLIFKGFLDIFESIALQSLGGAWWLGLLTGILELGLGFWASQQYYPTRGALLLLWIGFFALFRGISDMVVGFQLKTSSN
jgi:uncharacterized membrane protein HdeD (DUF308 family)